jgi:hypothetical protein
MSHSIGDEELLLCHWGDPALDPARRRAIRAALDQDAALRSRLRDLVAALDTEARALEPPALARDYAARLWSSLEPRLEPRPSPAPRPWAWVLRDWLGGPGMPRLAFAATLALALGVGIYVGRTQAPASPAVTLSDDAAQRVLAAYLNAHLESTERVLLVAANSPDETRTTQALARDLLSSNRLYAAAARRAGRPQLAAFLRQIEPVLLELARGEESEAVGARIRDEDLPFKARAAAAMARRGAAPIPDPELRPL